MFDTRKILIVAIALMLVAIPAVAWENPEGPVRTLWLETIGLKSFDAKAAGASVNTSSIGGQMGWVASPTMTLRFSISYDRARVASASGNGWTLGMTWRFYINRPEK